MRSKMAPSALGSGAAYSTNSKPSVWIGFSQRSAMDRILDPGARRKVAEAPEPYPPVALGWPGELEAREAREQAAEGDARLEARHVHAGAGVVALAEGDVAVRLARHVEAL